MKKKHLILLSCSILSLILAFLFDKEIVHLFSSLSNKNIVYIMQIMTSPYMFVGILVVTIILSLKSKKHYLVILSVLITSLVLVLLQHLIARQRPLVEHLTATTKYSFPSMHTAFIFALIPFLSKRPVAKKIFIPIICVMAFARLYLGVHYLSDIICGAIIGYIIGYIFISLKQPYKKEFKKEDFIVKPARRTA